MIGETVSHYRITDELGGGGMGVVYRAIDTKLDRPVALKFIPAELTRDHDAKQRFVHEAKAASALQHNNICTIHEIDETPDGRVFIVMDCYEGESLKERIARGPLPVDEAVGIAIQISEGLERAHAAGVVHRDVKPANIMITRDGVVKIVDFGLAKLSGQTRVTKTGTTIGTVAYMSPEQARGEEVDRRSDIWSLGVILYEMLAGRLPFRSDYELGFFYAILNESFEPVTRSRDDIPPELGRIVERTLKKDPAERYQFAGDLLADLKRLKGFLTADTSGIASGERYGKRPGRRRRSIYLAAGIAVAAVVAYLALTHYGPFSTSPSPPGRIKIAVLPFENLGPPEDDYFAAGMTEEITSRLAAIRTLGVISRTSVVQYDRSGKTIPQIGEDLGGVDYILEGTIRWDHRSGRSSRIRITPQLIRVADDTHLWTDIYERELHDIFALQAEIALEIVGRMNVTLFDGKPLRPDARPTDNTDAYLAYLRGLDYRQRIAFSNEDKILAQRMLERATDLDPGFALAHAALSQVHSFMYYVRDKTPERRTEALRAAEKALELVPDLEEGHVALAAFHYRCDRDYARALAEIELVRRIRPDDSGALDLLASIQTEQADFEEALATRSGMVELDPRNPDIIKDIAFLLMMVRRYEQADSCWARVITLLPEYTGAYESRAANRWRWRGDAQGARTILQTIPDTPQSRDPLWMFPNMFAQELYERDYEAALSRVTVLRDEMVEGMQYYMPKTQSEGLVHYLMGDSSAARESFESARIRLEQMLGSQGDDPRLHSALGIVYAALGRTQDALREGEKGIELGVAQHVVARSFRLEDLAFIFVLTGDYAAALDKIEELLSMPCLFSVGMLELDPRWDPLRDDPEYTRILSRYSNKAS